MDPRTSDSEARPGDYARQGVVISHEYLKNEEKCLTGAEPSHRLAGPSGVPRRV